MKPTKKTPARRLIRIDETAAMQYIHDNFNISGEAQRMCANLFDFAGRNDGIAENLMLSVLDGIGFDRTDLDRMTAKNILAWN